jgi:hypothetical protein
MTSNKANGKQISFFTYLVSSLIDEIYRKERAYIGNYDKNNILTIRSPIFEL